VRSLVHPRVQARDSGPTKRRFWVGFKPT
jgi:hypothetical protein